MDNFKLQKTAELLCKNITGFLNYFDEEYEKKLLALGKSKQQANALVRWDWTHGVALFALYKYYASTKDSRVLAEITNWFEERLACELPPVNVNTVCPMLTLACICEIQPSEKYLNIISQWAGYVMTQLPRTEENGIQHGHAELENKGHLWDDTLFMTVLFLAKAGELLNKPKYIAEAEYQFLLHAKYLTHKQSGLWYHGWTFEGSHNFAKALWGRGNCWITVFVPEFTAMNISEAVKKSAQAALYRQVSALKKLQNENGMWHTLLNDETSYCEASCTAGFCAGIFAGIKANILSKDYLPCAQKAQQAVLNNVSCEGELMQVSYGTNIGYSLQDYKDIPLRKMHYGQALALLAVLQG